MNIVKLLKFEKKNNCYLGFISLGNVGLDGYNKVSFTERKTKECLYFDLKPREEGFQFSFDCKDEAWSTGLWDLSLTSLQEEKPALPIEMDVASYPVETGIFSMEAICFVNSKKVFIPMVSKEKYLSIKVGSKNSYKIGYGVITVQDYKITEDILELTGIEWIDIKTCETFFVIESSDGSLRWQTPLMVEDKAEICLKECKQILFETTSCKRWSVWIEINTGKMLMRYALNLNVDRKKNEIYPLYQEAAMGVTCESGIVLHSRVGRELRFAYGEIEELIHKYSFGLLTAFDMKHEKLFITGKLYHCGSKVLALRLMQRESELARSYDFTLLNVSEQEGYIHFNAEVNIKDLNLEPLYWDFYLVVELEGKEELVRMKNNSNLVFQDMNKKMIGYTYKPSKGFVAFPYLTTYDAFSIMYREKSKYDSIYYKCKEYVAVWIYNRIKSVFANQEIWLVCEKYAETAQDNGFYFFDYCYKNHKERKIYYIMNKKSADYQKVRDMKKRVLPFMSLKHMIYMQAPVVMVSSEARAHFYAWKIAKGRVKAAFDRHPFVFLQHGVIGLKKVDVFFKKSFINADLFVTSSEVEKKIIVDNYGYEKEEVIVTGLARWDVITNTVDVAAPREIVLMPTWRTWLEAMSLEKFLESEYFKTYAALIKDERLAELAQKHNLVINFIIHPKLKRYITRFSSNCQNIRVYQFDEVPINEVLMRASMLITDYSSVAWEMYYSKKPVVFFRFDVEQYEKYQGSYMNLSEDIIGEVTNEIPDLIELVEGYVKTDFAEKEKFALERNQYFQYMDRNNAKRIYEEIEKKIRCGLR